MSAILITGGCGFIGSNLSMRLKASGHAVTVLDNLCRRGSERILDRILEHGCQFHHGDIRCPEDLERLDGHFDILIDCSAEPSILVGSQGADARYVFRNNLEGSINCFEFARLRKMSVLFLSTSRVYPYDTLNGARFREEATRFELETPQPGLSTQGVSTDFPLNGIRSLYGATKLSCELLLQEYAHQYNMPSIINRCGVVAGPWQLGKVDQGVFTYWLASHYFKKPLRYIGFGGKGKQVRDLMHIDDLCDLVEIQLPRLQEFRGQVFNAGGGRASHLSLQETTALCEEITGNSIPMGSETATRPADLIWYITDNTVASTTFGWTPKRTAQTILTDTYVWLCRHESEFRNLFSSPNT